MAWFKDSQERQVLIAPFNRVSYYRQDLGVLAGTRLGSSLSLSSAARLLTIHGVLIAATPEGSLLLGLNE